MENFMRKTILIFGIVGFITSAALGFSKATAAEEFAFENGDTNGDKHRDLSDAMYLLRYLFLGGPAPVAMNCGFEDVIADNGEIEAAHAS